MSAAVDRNKVPLLFIGDAVSSTSGLGRILRDLAIRVHDHCGDIYDVATFGYGGPGDRSLPFMQYTIEGMSNWFLPTLPDVWDNFAAGRKGAVFVVWDSSRTLWLSRADGPAGWSPDEHVRQWLIKKPFAKWTYVPVDAVGPDGGQSRMIHECLLGFDRVVAYSEWARASMTRNMVAADVEKRAVIALPHGIDAGIFRPHGVKKMLRQVFVQTLHANPNLPLLDHEKIVGIVATNQLRKDYGTAIQALADVAKEIPLRIFIQADMLERHWSIPALLSDYGLMANAIVNCVPVSDDVMSYVYGACDLTLGIGLGEGFGYSTFESLACGTPHVTGGYGGHAEHLRECDGAVLLEPKMYRMEGCYNMMRPVYDWKQWSWAIKKELKRAKLGTTTPKSLLPSQLDWVNLWPRWERWFREAHRSLDAGHSLDPRMDVIPVEHDSNDGTGMERSDRSRLRVVEPVTDETVLQALQAVEPPKFE